MTKNRSDSDTPREAVADPARRDFIARSLAAGVAVAASSTLAAAERVVESNVTIRTPEGICDAALFHPATGSHPGVLVWTDAFGLRPAMRDIGRCLAADGFAVLVPNPFYRVSKAPQFTSASGFDFKNPTQMAQIKPLMSSVNASGAAEKDATAHVAFLDAQPQTDRAK